MRIDMSGARAFLAYLRGEMGEDQLLEHPAYRTVGRHVALLQGLELAPGDVERGLRGEESPFYGLDKTRERLPEILEVMEFIETRGERWIREAEAFLGRLLPSHSTEGIVVYPIIGYDAGIGLEGAACLNVGASLYLEDPGEFPFVMVHEVCHVLHGRVHGHPDLGDGRDLCDPRGLLLRMLQDEGFATYAALKMREEQGHRTRASGPLVEDYQVVLDPGEAGEVAEKFRSTLERVSAGGLDRAEQLALIFGPGRLTYRAGARLFRLMEEQCGAGEVERAFHLEPREFWSTWSHLLD